jgi:hypothetical protein
MRFAPFAFEGPSSYTAQGYWDVNNALSWPGSGSLWYNIGKNKGLVGSNISISSSWFSSDSTGSFYQITGSQSLTLAAGLTTDIFNGTQQTMIYKTKLDSSLSSTRFYGRNDNPNLYWTAISGTFFAGYESPSYYNSALTASATMQNQYFYLVVQNNYSGTGYGTTQFLTSLDNFNIPYTANYSTGHGIAYALSAVNFLGYGIGKIQTMASYNSVLSTTQLQNYVLNGPIV